eukprot:c886_g1_i1.p1 GENE.c886_g1_i1~~c886_g1_i1.p1  ORF type:complete len:167 (+),score=49.14 c886_g1_i1:49-501(+)
MTALLLSLVLAVSLSGDQIANEVPNMFALPNDEGDSELKQREVMNGNAENTITYTVIGQSAPVTVPLHTRMNVDVDGREITAAVPNQWIFAKKATETPLQNPDQVLQMPEPLPNAKDCLQEPTKMESVETREAYLEQIKVLEDRLAVLRR